MIQQLTEAINRFGNEKQATENRLNEVFALVDQRFTEAQSGAQEIVEGAQRGFNVMTESVTVMASDVMDRLNALSKDLRH